MSRKASSSSSTSHKVGVHNKNQSLRAASKSKISQQQRQRQLASGTSSSSITSQTHKEDPAPVDLVPSPLAPTLSKVSLGKRKEQDAPEQAQVQRKQVFKQVLASPLTVNWPNLAPIDAQPILYTLLDVLAHPALRTHVRRVQSSRPDRRSMSRGDQRRARKTKYNQKDGSKQGDISSSDTSSLAHMDVVAQDEEAIRSEPGALVCGINSVTRHMESEIAYESTSRKAAELKQDITSISGPSPLRLIFICRTDIDPPKLVSHFPMLTCALNAVCHPVTRKSSPVLVIPLPAGSELLIAKALHVRRCAALGIATSLLAEDVTKALFSRIADSGLQPLRADWLDTAADSALRTRDALLARAGLSSTSGPSGVAMKSYAVVKNVATTAPANLNAAKLQNKHTRDEKKAWRKAVRKKEQGEERKRIIQERRRRREVRRRGTSSAEVKVTAKKNPRKLKRVAFEENPKARLKSTIQT